MRMSASTGTARLVPTTEAAKVLGVHPDTVRRAARAGLIRPVRLGRRGNLRFRLEDIERIVAGERS